MSGPKSTRSIVQFEVYRQFERNILVHNFMEENEIIEVKSFA